jgi:T5orf172 domain
VSHQESVNDRSTADNDSRGIRGWVYVITNRAMPDLVKVGFSRKDPHLRAKEMAGTGVPHPYVVAYDVLVYGPRDLERRVHKKLVHMREGKEWFKCSVAQAIDAIQALERDGVLLEQVNHKHASFPSPTSASPTTQDQISGAHATMRDAGASLLTAPASATGTRAAGTYRGLCGHCGESFSTTLARGDTVTRCPSCLRLHDVSGFLKAELTL